MVICCVPFCKSRSDRGRNIKPDGTKITFHEIPCDEKRRTAWLHAISQQGENSNTHWKTKDKAGHSVVCSLHFHLHDFKQGLKIRSLLPTAIPSVFSDFPDHKQKLYQKQRKQVKVNDYEPVSTPSKSSFSSELESINLNLLASVCSEQEHIPTVNHVAVNTNLTNEKLCKDRRKYASLLQRFRRLKKAIKGKDTLIRNLKKENEKMSKKLKILNINKIETSNSVKGEILIEQLKYFGMKKPRWSERTIRWSILLRNKSNAAYNFIRQKNMFSLPSKSTLRRYIGPTSGATVSSLIKQRLTQEAKNLTQEVEYFGSLIIDEMNIQPCVMYSKQSDEITGVVTTSSDISTLEIEEKVANKLLCFIFTGLCTRFRLPVAYYFTKGMSGKELAQLTKTVLYNIEDVGFRVIRIVTDNHITNVKMFEILSGDNVPKPVITHPVDSSRILFLSYDPCHILKNFRNIFFSRQMINKGQPISADFIRILYNIQKQNVIKPVRNLTHKHVYPSKFEKMNVSRAIKIFSTEMITAMKFLNQNADSLGQQKFLEATGTIQFLEMVHKWFSILNVTNTNQHIISKNPYIMHFVSVNDSRLNWLQETFLKYLEEWQESCDDPSHFISKETYLATKMTTESSVECIKFLLNSGFHYVLTRKLNSDEIESFFSALQQMSGSNDMTNANNCIQNMHKMLVTGIVTSSLNANVSTTNDEWMTSMEKVHSFEVYAALSPEKFRENLEELEICPSGFPAASVQTASMAFVAGYLVHAVEKNIHCGHCLESISSQRCPSPLMRLINVGDRGGLKYPKPFFVMLLLKIEIILKLALFECENIPNLSLKLREMIVPHLSLNPIISWICPSSSHNSKLCDFILKKFISPYLTNYVGNMNEMYQNKRRLRLNKKPMSRKVRKVAIT